MTSSSASSPYGRGLRYAGVIAPSCEVPTEINQPLNLPDMTQSSTFIYDFSVEKEALKIAEESIKMVAESKQHLEEYVATKDKERARKEEKNKAALAALSLKQEEARAAAQLRQASVDRHKREEVERKVEEDARTAVQLLRTKSRQEDDRQAAGTQRERELITQFQQWTGATDEECKHYLSAYDWKLDKAVQAFFGRNASST